MAFFGREEIELLEAILAEQKRSNDFICKQLKFIGEELLVIENELFPPPDVTGFTIQQTGASPMGTTPTPPVLAPPDPGSTLVFTATPTPAGAVLPVGVIPVWTSSDPTNASVSADPTGLIGTVVLSSAIPVGESVTLTVTATLPDGTTPTGSASFTVGALPPVEVTGFTVIQTA
jgi:hypothetical protein